jgi:hypothetical protein
VEAVEVSEPEPPQNPGGQGEVAAVSSTAHVRTWTRDTGTGHEIHVSRVQVLDVCECATNWPLPDQVLTPSTHSFHSSRIHSGTLLIFAAA